MLIGQLFYVNYRSTVTWQWLIHKSQMYP